MSLWSHHALCPTEHFVLYFTVYKTILHLFLLALNPPPNPLAPPSPSSSAGQCVALNCTAHYTSDSADVSGVLRVESHASAVLTEATPESLCFPASKVVKVGGGFSWVAVLRRRDFISSGCRERAETAREFLTLRLLTCSMVRRHRSTWTNTSLNCLEDRL